MADSRYAVWLARAADFRRALKKMEVDCPPPSVSGPASEEQARGVEQALGFALPESLRQALIQFAARFEFRWSLRRIPAKGLKGMFRNPQKLTPWVEMPDRFATVYSGQAVWDIDNLAALEKARQVWVKRVFSKSEKPFDRVWQSAFLFMEIANGDMLGIDKTRPGEPVVYVCQEWSELHGMALGDNFGDFVDRWSKIGFVGPEDWQLQPFVPSSETGLDPGGEAAKEWRAFIGAG